MPLDMICPVIRTPTLHLVANRIPEICLFLINIVTYFDRMEDIDHSSGMRTNGRSSNINTFVIESHPAPVTLDLSVCT